MRRTPVNDYLEDISTELPEEIYGYLSDAIYETVCEFDEEVAQLKAENAKLWELVNMLRYCAHEAHGICARWPVGGGRPFTCCPFYDFDSKEYRCKKLMRELGIEV